MIVDKNDTIFYRQASYTGFSLQHKPNKFLESGCSAWHASWLVLHALWLDKNLELLPVAVELHGRHVHMVNTGPETHADDAAL